VNFMQAMRHVMELLSERRRADAAETEAGLALASSRTSFFANFLAALHESRRCEAAGEIERYRHLAQEAHAYTARREAERERSERPQRRRSDAAAHADHDHQLPSGLSPSIWRKAIRLG
jgi:hypothetical protein